MPRPTSAADLRVSFRTISKYLIPWESPIHLVRSVRAPRAWIDAADLAVTMPDAVSQIEVSPAESLAPLPTVSFASGRREVRVYPELDLPAETVTVIRNGRSYGREGTVISPNGEWAVRDSGHFHSWERLRGGLRTFWSMASPTAWRRRWESDVTRRRRLPGVRRLDATVAVLNLRSCYNYFHWLTEVVARATLVARAGVRPDYYLVDCYTPEHEVALAYVGIRKCQLIQPHFGLTLEARELVLPSLPQRAAQLALRESICTATREDANHPVTPFPRRVFISRRNAGTRRLKNEQVVAAMLEQRGFETHCLEGQPFARQIEIFQNARTIVTTHGAALGNLVMARPHAKVVEFIYPGRFNNDLYPRFSQWVGLDHVQVEAPRSRHKQVLRPDVNDIAAAIDWVEGVRESKQRATRRRAA
jgi:hypothetical protein